MSQDKFSRLRAHVAMERSLRFDWTEKSSQPRWYGESVAKIAHQRERLFEQSTPMLTLDGPAVNRNIAAMNEWCDARGVRLAPHGKTTMAPALWLAQLDAGAWAITVANEAQLRVARGAGVPRVMLANLLIRPEALRWVRAEMNADREFEFLCWVDSVPAAEAMDHALVGRVGRPIDVLVEVGSPGVRTGVRGLSEARRVAEAVSRSSHLRLVGVTGYEGVVAKDDSIRSMGRIDEFLRAINAVFTALEDLFEIAEPIMSAGGSAYFDHVVDVLDPAPGVLVLRSGAYVVHDDGIYAQLTPETRGAGPSFEAAMHVWARVLSIPEQGLALLDAGRRDLPFDERLPGPQLVARRAKDGTLSVIPLVDHRIRDLNDQHAYMHLPTDSPVCVGDVVRLGLSHPCTAFDKWSVIPLIADADDLDPVIIDFVRTYF